MKFTEETIKRLNEWLGPDGVELFLDYKKSTGTVSPVLPMHPVHLREGMQVRNWMRDQPELSNMNQEELDDNWALLVDETIKLKNE